MSISPSRRIGIGIAVATAAVAFAAPAQADVTAVSVSAGTLDVNQAYTITANVSGSTIGLSVFFSDNGQKLGGAAGSTPDSLKGIATTSWTPTTAGTHTLVATQGSTSRTITVTVVDPSAGGGTTTTTTPPTTTTTTPPPTSTTTTPLPPTGSCS